MRMKLFIAALFVASLNLRPAITSVSPLLETIRSELGMSGLAASLLTTLPVLCMGVFAPTAVRWIARWGMERSLVLTMVLIGAATLLRYFAGWPYVLHITSFLAGVGIAVAGPLLSGFIKKHFAERSSAVIGFYSAALVIGAAVSSGLAVPLQEALGGSWQASLASWGWLAVAALPLWLWIARRSAEPQAAASSAEAAGRLATAAAGPAQAGAAASSARLPLRQPRAWLLTFFFGLVALIYYSTTAWLAPAVEAMGYDRAAAGAVLTLFSFVQMPVSLVLPILMQRYGNRLYWLLSFAACELCGLLLLGMAGSPWAAAVLLGIGAGGLFPVALLLPIEAAQSPDEAGAWSAMSQSGGYMISSLGPLFVGVLHDASDSFAQPLFGLAGLVVVMMLLIFGVGRNKKAGQVLVIGSRR